MKKELIAKQIDKLFSKTLGTNGDYRIYFNNKAIEVNSSTGRQVIENIKASDYTEYGDDNGICVTYDGTIYELMNFDNKFYLVNELNILLDTFDCWYENGNTWNFNVYKN